MSFERGGTCAIWQDLAVRIPHSKDTRIEIELGLPFLFDEGTRDSKAIKTLSQRFFGRYIRFISPDAKRVKVIYYVKK